MPTCSSSRLHNLEATPSYRLIPDGENRDTLTRRRGFLIKVRGREHMARRITTGRRAAGADRERAESWVEMYRLAQASPDGRHCLNPEDEWECQTFIDAADPEPLLKALEGFVKNGTFAMIHDDAVDVEGMLMRREMKALRAGGIKHDVAIEELAEKHNTSESTITRMVRRTVKA